MTGATLSVGPHIQAGIDNLLHHCLAVQAGERLLIIHEDPSLGWYDKQTPMAVADAAEKIGVLPTMLAVGAPTNQPDDGVTAAIAAHDCTLFFARLGDQDRFAPPRAGQRGVMCYVRSLQMLASDFCRTPYGALKELKTSVDQVISQAHELLLTCAQGSQISGKMVAGRHQGTSDVSTLRFPLGVGTPVLADVFSGQVALTHFLTPTGCKVYDPPSLQLSATVFARVERGRIVGFDGDAKTVAAIQAHYQRVADAFGIDAAAVHSWHAGIHPACVYEQAASLNPDRWSNTVFGSPRFAHFHTCGSYPPGEISWMILNPTITIDGVALWDAGRLCPQSFAATRICLERWPTLTDLFRNPSEQTGLDS